MKRLNLGMSNFDYIIDKGFEDALREHPNEVFGKHYGWNFNGKVYFDSEMFVEDVYCFGTLRETIKAKTLKELMDSVNDEYGWE